MEEEHRRRVDVPHGLLEEVAVAEDVGDGSVTHVPIKTDRNELALVSEESGFIDRDVERSTLRQGVIDRRRPIRIGFETLVLGNQG